MENWLVWSVSLAREIHVKDWLHKLEACDIEQMLIFETKCQNFSYLLMSIFLLGT